ncbi:MAG TPA: DUF4115 domain-containing protein [Acidimicrobiales bacterium]|nr:DUF4115 domain-containing protein [Acidimicrobiales bacterium]
MTVVLVLGAVAVLAAVVVGSTRRRSGDERHSVDDYHHTIDTLRHLSDRSAATGLARPPLTTRGVGPTVQEGQGAPLGAVSASTARAAPTPYQPAPASPRLSPSSTVSKLASGRALYGRRGGRDGARPAGQGRRGLVTAVTAVVLVALVAGAVAVALAPSRSPHKPKASTSTSAPGARPDRSASRSSSSSSKRSTTTTAATIEPTTSSALSAAYKAPASTYTVELSATAPCWVEASQSSTGQVLWTGTLEAGQSQKIPVTGSLTIRLGAAFDVELLLDGLPVILPSGHGSPFDVTFQSA